ncbi:nuclease-related domain-containing protein [Vibrio cholerae]|uniref:nuclease-related domain-containing protein n=1 Tax=Vibrio cholerae TaxID=666 RepID=UPI000E0C0B6A|nr:NERD domain-containing protein [Vibrio cholerae]EJL6702775.1 NERD domain-containing protein [Vibrio cholerae]MCD1171299.1 nuclease [Vibrio cholerae]MCD1189335.1 nuclease [Vibrio cholerae]MCD1196882.1 nuclease [Vibrio cholerae]MCD1200622.1 nuclease [Vibrio cholerae]
MDIFGLFSEAFAQVWYLIPLLFVISLFKSRWFKGVFGEFLVNKLLSQLPTSDYTLVKDVTLPTEDGTTQIDHIVVSKFGVFVIETKNMKGWIFGSKDQKQWTQKIYRHSSKFQNPLHQNYKHVKTLELLLNIDSSKVHSVIVFIGDSTFKTEMPENVTYARGCLNYIKQIDQPVFSDAEYIQLIDAINCVKLDRGVVTDFKHRKHVKELVASKESVKQCSRCGSEMVLRETKRGENKGKQFWGCSGFPNCKTVEKFN